MENVVYYRDGGGYVKAVVDSDCGLSIINFEGGYCYFESNGKDYKIPVSAVAAIAREIV